MADISNSKGFILVELLVVIAIISILTFTLLFDFNTGEKSLALQRNAYKIAQDIRWAQESTMSAKESALCIAGATGYGIIFDMAVTTTQYRLFVNCDTAYYWNPGSDKILKTVDLDPGIEISEIIRTTSGVPETKTAITIVFVPPDPITYIDTNDTGREAKIIIVDQEDASLTRDIIINNVGRIEIK